MKSTNTLSVFTLAVLALAAGCSSSNDRYPNSRSNDSRYSDNRPSDDRGGYEVSRTESDKTGWFGGQTHAVNTTYKNDDGSTSVQTETTFVKGNETTITRERRTTAVDGTVKVDKETRTITKGTDSVQRESSTSGN